MSSSGFNPFDSVLSSDPVEVEEDLFRHTNRTLAAIRADNARRKQEKSTPQKKTAKDGVVRRRASDSESSGGEQKRQKKQKQKKPSPIKESKSEVKRRRIDAKDREELLRLAGVPQSISVLSSDEDEPNHLQSSPSRRLRQRPVDRVRETASRTAQIQSIDDDNDDEDDLQFVSTNIRARDTAAPEEEEEDESDPEFAELKRRAREKNKTIAQSNNTQGLSSNSIADKLVIGASQRPTDRSRPDAKIKLLITSPFDGIEPYIIYRMLSERLQEVREAWCARFMPQLPSMKATDIFFTHNGRRLWDVTTCRSLGIEADEEGRAYLVSDRTKDGVEYVHLEAMDQAHLEELKAERLRAATAHQADADTFPATPDGGHDDVDQTPPEDVANIRITIKAKDCNDVRIKVAQTTTIEKILRAARKAFSIADTQQIYLEFDGEKLDPAEEVRNTEIEDMVGLDLFLAR